MPTRIRVANQECILSFCNSCFYPKISEISLPRPLLVEYLPRYSDEQRRRHDVRPGLTGYAQAYGRNAISWEEKFEKDVYYVDNISFLLDIKIFFKTVEVVLKREGISSETSATMEDFMGSEEKEGEEV